GDLRIDSAPGAGTVASLYLPAERTPLLASPSHPAREAPTTSLDAGARQAQRVLVVEDDDAVRAIAVAFLRAAGHVVEAVADAEAALQRLRADTGFTLLFTDVMLGPGMDGKTLAREARELQPGLSVLLTSGDDKHDAGV